MGNCQIRFELVHIRAQIYFRQPSPVTNYWINLSCQPEHYDINDRIADSGGRWIDVPKAKASVFYMTAFSHADFEDMMREKVFMNKSPEDMLCIQLEKVK